MKLIWIAGVIAGTVALISCGGGGSSSGGGSVGVSTVQGNVVSVSAANSLQFEPGPRALLATVMDLISSPLEAQSGVGNVIVTVGGQSTVTDAGGNFTVINVPAGDQVITFQSGNIIASLTLSIPAGVTVALRNVTISGGNANPSGGVDVVQGPDGNDNTGVANNNDDDSNDNTGVANNNTDDDSNDNDAANSNDDDDSDDSSNSGNSNT